MRAGHKPWTDEERGFIQDHDDWKPAKIAEALGRTAKSVGQQRKKLRAGWSPTKDYWAKSEDEFMLANQRMSSSDIATHLGRTTIAVARRRVKLRANGMVEGRFGGNWSPTSAGARPLLAKTCSACGLLLQAHWFDSSNGYRIKVCRRCSESAKSSRIKTARQKVQARAARNRLQSLTLAGASQSGQPWTEADFSVLRDPDLTILQKALTLHRTYSATAEACSKNGFKSHVGLGDPERDQWIIDNPNAGNVDDIAASLAPNDAAAPAEAKKSTPAWDWDDADLAVSA